MESGASRQIIKKFLDNDVSNLSSLSEGFTSSQIDPEVSQTILDKSGDFSINEHAFRVASFLSVAMKSLA